MAKVWFGRATRVAALGIAVFVQGCISPAGTMGTKMEKEDVAKIQKGKTTRQELEQWFGVPIMSNMMPDGTRMVSWSFNDTDISPITLLTGGLGGSGQMRSQQLQVILNQNGVVKDFEFSDNTGTTKYGWLGGSTSTSKDNQKSVPEGSP